MPDLPTWLIEILRQFPMVVVIGLAVWYAEKRVREKEIRLEGRFDSSRKSDDERNERLRTEVRQDRNAEIRRLQDVQIALGDANEKVLEAKDEQIARLIDEVEQLSKQLAALTKKLQG